MFKTFLKLSLIASLAACAQNAATGPDGTEQTGDGTLPDPAAEGTKNAAEPGDGSSTSVGAIDFGAAPKGAAALSTVTCPALSMPKPTSAPIVYVDANAKGAEDGTKAAPFNSLMKAFGSAKTGALIFVAAGKYGEQLMVPNKDLTVLGGFASGFGSRTNACATVFEAPNANAPVFMAGFDVQSFAIEGLTVQKGVRGLFVMGGGNAHGNYTVARCVFAANGTKERVGGAVATDGANVRIFGSVFHDNIAAKGAAVSVSGDVKLTIDQNVFLDNLGYSDHGGGLYINATASKISRNTFKGNRTGVGINRGWGGALIIYSSSLAQRAKADLSYNVFTENVAGIGGAVFFDDGSTITMSHDLLYRNRGYKENGVVHGSAIYVDGTGLNAEGTTTLTAEYLTVANNNYDEQGAPTTESFGGNVYVEGWGKASFSNSIFWNNGPNGFFVATDMRGKNELRIGNSIGSSTCTTANALGFVAANAAICKMGATVFTPAAIYFGDEAANDYHEKSVAGRFSKGSWIKDSVTSPAIDMADPMVKVDSEPMPNGNRANLGAFSQTDEASMSP